MPVNAHTLFLKHCLFSAQLKKQPLHMAWGSCLFVPPVRRAVPTRTQAVLSTQRTISEKEKAGASKVQG